MNWNDHSALENRHAILAPSSCSWMNYDLEDQEELYSSLFQKHKSYYATMIGTKLHEYAKDRIDYKLRLTKSSKSDVMLHLLKSNVPREVIDMDYIYDNFMEYVNDGIGYRMDTEKCLFYSNDCFGHADTILYDPSKKILRIHDYKSGTTPAHIEQLRAYAALFYLEYGLSVTGDRNIVPENVTTILRLYQTDNCIEEVSEPEDLRNTMRYIVEECKILESIRTGSKV